MTTYCAALFTYRLKVVDMHHLTVFFRNRTRVGHLNDFFISDDFLSHLNGCTDIFQPDIVERALVFDSCNIPLERTVQDAIVNNYGYKLIEFCKK